MTKLSFKILLAFICLLAPPHFINAQQSQADLLDIRFLSQGQAKDLSAKQFPVQPGPVTPETKFDPNIKQYVACFPQNTSLNRYFKVDYKGNSDFINKIKQAFTLEVYVKATGSSEMTPVGSMQEGGFGIMQMQSETDTLTQFRVGTTRSSGYSYAGNRSIYNKIKQEYYHLVFTCDGNNLRVYYNGVNRNEDNYLNSGSLRLSDQNTAHWIAIGGDASTTSSIEKPFRGEIAMVRMYSKALSNSEVSALYQQVENRKKLSNAELLNKLLTITLPQYANQSQAKQYLEEGWRLMQSLSTTEQDINSFKSKVESNLGITAPEVSAYPRFAVISDIHVGSPAENNIYYSRWPEKLPRALKYLKEQNPKLDAVFVVGDVTDHGLESELKNAVKGFSVISDVTPVYYSMGNHEWHHGNGDVFKSVIGQRLNQFIEIKGYPFIMVSLDSKDQLNSYTSTARNYLSAALQKASQEYPGKPIFVYMHVPLENTIYATYPIPPGTRVRSDGTKAMKEICNQYPQVIVFSGHSHMPLNDERCIAQDKFTAVHDGHMAYMSVEDGKTEGINPPGYSNVASGCIVSVNENSDVTIKRMDLINNKEIKQPWIIKAPHNGSQFIYNKSRAGGNAPYFKVTDKISTSITGNGSYTITFPQATDDDMVHHYICKLLDKNGKQIQYATYFSRFYLNEFMPSSLSWSISGLKPTSDYTVEIKAVDSFNNESEPLSGNLAESIVIEKLYLTGSSAPCGWTNSSPVSLNPVSGEEGVFEWTGTLKAGEFKFLQTKGSWSPSMNPLSTQTIVSGKEYSITTTDAITGDYKFNVNKSMNCSMKVDTKKRTVVVTEVTAAIYNLYLTGSAAPCGWSRSNSLAMNPINGEDGVFEWTGALKAGEFKFLLTNVSWDPSMNPLSTQTIVSGKEYSITTTDAITGDYKFNVNKSMNYSIKVDTKKRTVVVTEMIYNLYLTGSAAPCGWSNSSPVVMSPASGEEGVFEWTGTLKAGEFKFLLTKGSWAPSMNPLSTQTVVSGNTYGITTTDAITGDYKFNVSKAMECSIKVDTKKRTVVVTSNNLKAATGTEGIDEKTVSISSENRQVKVVSSLNISTARLMNLQGAIAGQVENENKTTFYLGQNLTPGVYIVELISESQRLVYKVLVK